MEETVYLDQLRLLAVDHPAAYEVFPNERFVSNPPFPEFRVIASQDGASLRCVGRSRQRCSLVVSPTDRKYVTDFPKACPSPVSPSSIGSSSISASGTPPSPCVSSLTATPTISRPHRCTPPTKPESKSSRPTSKRSTRKIIGFASSKIWVSPQVSIAPWSRTSPENSRPARTVSASSAI